MEPNLNIRDAINKKRDELKKERNDKIFEEIIYDLQELIRQGEILRNVIVDGIKNAKTNEIYFSWYHLDCIRTDSKKYLLNTWLNELAIPGKCRYKETIEMVESILKQDKIEYNSNDIYLTIYIK